MWQLRGAADPSSCLLSKRRSCSMTKLSVLIGVPMLAAMTSTGMSKGLGEVRQELASMAMRGGRFTI
jgi:hypothetical protein